MAVIPAGAAEAQIQGSPVSPYLGPFAGDKNLLPCATAVPSSSPGFPVCLQRRLEALEGLQQALALPWLLPRARGAPSGSHICCFWSLCCRKPVVGAAWSGRPWPASSEYLRSHVGLWEGGAPSWLSGAAMPHSLGGWLILKGKSAASVEGLQGKLHLLCLSLG